MIHGSKEIIVIQLPSEPASKYHTWYAPLLYRQSGVTWILADTGKGNKNVVQSESYSRGDEGKKAL